MDIDQKTTPGDQLLLCLDYDPMYCLLYILDQCGEVTTSFTCIFTVCNYRFRIRRLTLQTGEPRGGLWTGGGVRLSQLRLYSLSQRWSFTEKKEHFIVQFITTSGNTQCFHLDRKEDEELPPVK